MSNRTKIKPTGGVKDWLAGGKLPERIHSVCLRGDLYAEIQRHQDDLNERERAVANHDRLVGDPEAKRLAGVIQRLRAEMAEASRDFTVRGLSSRAFRDLTTQYPPRTGNAADERAGWNRDEVTEALTRACVIDPVLDDDDWTILLTTLTDGQYDALATVAWEVNRGAVSIPFSPLASTVLTSESE